MRLIMKLLVLLLLLVSNLPGLAQAMEKITVDPSMRRVLRLHPEPSTYRVPARAFPRAEALATTATFQVNYTGFTTAQQQAFQAAVDIWSQLISSTVPIVIDATWAQLDPGVLGSSGPNALYVNVPNGQPNTVYVVALANKLVGYDIEPGVADMHITFNTDYASTFYYGVDGNPPISQIDFESVILHEICHGLGFMGSFYSNGILGTWGLTDGISTYPIIFDPLYYNGSSQQLINTSLYPNPSLELLGQMTSNNVFCRGVKVMQANGGNPVKIYAPSTWSQGSSMSHWDEIYRNTINALMLYAISHGESIHDPGPFTMALLQDIGWGTVGHGQLPPAALMLLLLN
jgi:hypothetical protein